MKKDFLGETKRKAEEIIKEYGGINNKDENGEITLHWAAILGDVDVIEYLINKGADINSRTVFRLTPLDIAELFENKGAIDILKKFLGD